MTDLAVLVPVLKRPHRVKPLLYALSHTVPGCWVLFLPDPDDDEEIEAIRRELDRTDLNVGCRPVTGGWAHKINVGVKVTPQSLIFLGADDLEFRTGWFEAAQRKLTPGIGLVGVNDLIRRRRDHTTHFVMTREYAQLPCIDGSPGPVSEVYDHNFCDDELIATAKKRGAYAYAQDSHVKHFHPFGGDGQDDEVYEKGREQFRQDRRRFQSREPLWT